MIYICRKSCVHTVRTFFDNFFDTLNRMQLHKFQKKRIYDVPPNEFLTRDLIEMLESNISSKIPQNFTNLSY